MLQQTCNEYAFFFFFCNWPMFFYLLCKLVFVVFLMFFCSCVLRWVAQVLFTNIGNRSCIRQQSSKTMLWIEREDRMVCYDRLAQTVTFPWFDRGKIVGKRPLEDGAQATKLIFIAMVSADVELLGVSQNLEMISQWWGSMAERREGRYRPIQEQGEKEMMYITVPCKGQAWHFLQHIWPNGMRKGNCYHVFLQLSLLLYPFLLQLKNYDQSFLHWGQDKTFFCSSLKWYRDGRDIEWQ
jgi:hypothetical protein